MIIVLKRTRLPVQWLPVATSEVPFSFFVSACKKPPFLHNYSCNIWCLHPAQIPARPPFLSGLHCLIFEVNEFTQHTIQPSQSLPICRKTQDGQSQKGNKF
uniref:Uncharacterized protein n=1 Tax=Anguilla anguilla TaxID=7936 RepID=A0A0E9XGM4_ANGAN